MNRSLATIFHPFLLLALTGIFAGCTQKNGEPVRQQFEIGPGWAQNSVNAPIFRKNSIVSDENWQFVSYYNADGNVVIARRTLDSEKWETIITPFKGNIKDAHNTISMMLDGAGYLHLSWDHHNNNLHYTRSLQPYGLTFPNSNPTMIGEQENVVSYPEFYRFSNGDLLFAYRDGGSGNGNLVLNRYDTLHQKWTRLQSNLIDGQGARNAYWQLCVDARDAIHISWVWRETPNVSSNHDLSYARSDDGGISWKQSDGTPYALPINIQNAEIIHSIPQKSNLINQTSMTTDAFGNPYIVTYYRETPEATTQFHLIYQNGSEWFHSQATQRSLDFELEGIGSRSIPISRPQILLSSLKNPIIRLLYRDEEMANKVCVSTAQLPELQWETNILWDQDMGRWEPSYDSSRWQSSQELHLFLQTVGQGQAETLESIEPTTVSVLKAVF